MGVIVSVCLYIDFLKKLLTDFNQTWQNDVSSITDTNYEYTY